MARRVAASPTLADVAREARVSLMTASRVLNRSPNVRQEKVAKVQAAMGRLAYRPNELARSLMTRRSSTIGMIVANLSNPFITDVIKELQNVARENGYVVTVASSENNPDIERVEIDTLVRRQIDALVIAPVTTRGSLLRSSVPATLPVVIFDQFVRGGQFDSVTISNRRSALQATAHMLGHGFRNLVAVGTRPHSYTSRERVAGYTEAVRRASIEPRVCMVDHDELLTPVWFEREVFQRHQADALFTLNWISTLHCLRALRSLGKRVGRDVPLLSFDDFDLGDLLSPRLSVVKQPSNMLGRESARLLFERLKGSVESPPRKIVLQASLVIRDSCGCHSS